MHLPRKSRTAGFTLFELVMVIVVLGIIAAFTAGNMYSQAEMSLPTQAQKMASDIDLAKTLGYTSGKRMRITVTGAGAANARYDVNCVPSATNPGDTPSCNTSNDFFVILQKGVVLTAPATLDINSLGQPSNSAGVPLVTATTYTLTFGSTETISVAALTGIVTVTP